MLILLILGALGLCALCFLCTAAFYSASFDPSYYKDLRTTSGLDLEYSGGDENSSNKILVIPIQGVILNEKPDDLIAFLSTDVTYGYEVKNILVEAAQDDSIKGVVLAIDSPGGTVTGSKAISDGVENYKAMTNKPVVAHIMGMGASGGYWSAVAADHIIADSGSLIGSIGVIFGPFKYYQEVTAESSGGESIATDGGIETYYITSGEYKDFGNPYRVMTDVEKQIMQDDTDAVYEEFVQYVSSRRNITVANVKSQIKGLPYGNERALELNLIDANGPKEDAYSYLTQELGLGSDYQIVKVFEEVDFWDLFFSALGKDQNVSVSADYIGSELNNKLLFYYGNP